MNELIKGIFNDFAVDGVQIPVKYLVYHGHGEPYITFMEIDGNNALFSDDELRGYVHYYDFDIYSKGNFFPIIERVKQLLNESGFVFQPSRTSPDFYEPDTGYYHKTLNFAYIKEEENSNG